MADGRAPFMMIPTEEYLFVRWAYTTQPAARLDRLGFLEFVNSLYNDIVKYSVSEDHEVVLSYSYLGQYSKKTFATFMDMWQGSLRLMATTDGAQRFMQ